MNAIGTASSTRPAIVVACVLMGACTLFLPPGVQVVEPDTSGYISPDDFRADSKSYPAYQAVRRMEFSGLEPTTGLWLAPIEVADRWLVTHRVGERLLIYSEEYQKRQCTMLQKLAVGSAQGGPGRGLFGGRCIPQHLYYIFILEDGTVVGGWQLLKNPDAVLFASDRRTRFRGFENFEEWGPQPLFTVTEPPNNGVQPTPHGGAADAKR